MFFMRKSSVAGLLSLAFAGTVSAQDVIVHADAADAASELKIYLKSVSGRNLPVIEEKKFDGKRLAFYVGQTAFARKNGVDFSKFAPEEWCYRSVGKNVVLGGHRINGNEFAVWHFLENELGIRWFTFESTYIPKRKVLSFAALNRRGKPAFLERHLYAAPWKQKLSRDNLMNNLRMERRNRLNPGKYSPVILSKKAHHCHSYYDYVSPKKYFKTHPEYFSMDKSGKRFHGRNHVGGQLCLSNPEVAQVAAKQLLEYIRQDRAELPKEKWPVMYDISQNDSTHWICLCPECKKISAAEGGEAALVVLFTNRVAKAIEKDYPEITLRAFAYVSTDVPPKTLRCAKNVQIRWCDLFTRSDCYRPLSSKFNTVQKAKLDGWKRQDARLSIWDYWNMDLPGPYFTPPRVETMIDAIAPDIRYFRSLGVEMLSIEAETVQFGHPQNFVDLQFWLGTQLLDDPDKDEEKLIAEFLTKHYGPAAGKMRQVLDLIRGAVKKEQAPLFYCVRLLREYQTGPFLRKVYELLNSALESTPPGSDYRFRVEKELISPIAVILSQPYLQTGLDRKQLLREYRQYRTARIEKYADPAQKKKLLKNLESDFMKYSFVMKVPEQFKHYPADRIRMAAFPNFLKSEPDPDSVTGRAFGTPEEKPTNQHIMKIQAGGYMPTWFGLYDNDTRKGMTFRLNDIPQDEKYHWYKMGKYKIGRRSFLWGFFWRMLVYLEPFWAQADGVENYNVWTFWISVKITGPAYVKNSTKPNRIMLDQIILTKD